jgi:predicted SPOUT superfamily RNA methylase MTH1
MSGRASRQKGMRNEYKLRDELIQLGYQARRVPLSGAQEGYKGDVVFEKQGRTLTAEVKSRKDSFKSLYTLLFSVPSRLVALILKDGDGEKLSELAVMGFSLEDVMSYNGVYVSLHAKQARKLKNIRKWVQKCDILAVKDDRKPFIYVRYL